MDTVSQAWLQLGVAGVLTLSTVGFLYHLLTRTLPEMQRHCRDEITAQQALFVLLLGKERDLRLAESAAFVKAMAELERTVLEGQAKILDRADFGANQLGGEIIELRAAVEARLPPQRSPK